MKIINVFKLSILLCFCVFTSILEAQNKAQQSGLPLACINGKTEGRITKSELLNSGELSLKNNPDSSSIISSFRITVVNLGKGIKEISNNKDGNFTNEIKSAIQSAALGDKIFFEYIQALYKNKVVLKLAPIAFIISE